MERIFGNTSIYWINLDRSSDRRQHMMEQLKGTNNYRIGAIDGIDENKYLEYKIINPNPKFSPSLNAIVATHMKAIKLAKLNELDYVIIMEDKCHFEHTGLSKYTIQDMIKIMDAQDQSWDIIQLSPVCTANNNYQDYIRNNFRITKWRENQYGCNYLINKRGIDKMLNLIPTDGEKIFDFTTVSRQVDPEKIILGNMNSYAINYPLFYVYWDTSTFDQYYKNDSTYPKQASLLSLKVHKKNVEEFFKK